MLNNQPKTMAKKLTWDAQIAIVRRFREYSVRFVRETRRAEGGEKPTQSNQALPQSRKWRFALYWIQEIHRRTFPVLELKS